MKEKRVGPQLLLRGDGQPYTSTRKRVMRGCEEKRWGWAMNNRRRAGMGEGWTKCGPSWFEGRERDKIKTTPEEGNGEKKTRSCQRVHTKQSRRAELAMLNSHYSQE